MEPTVQNPLVIMPILLATGFIAGSIGSLVGLGGGWLMVPALTTLGVDPAHAVTTSLIVIAAGSAAAIRRNHRQGHRPALNDLLMAVPAVATVEVGRRLLNHWNETGVAQYILTGTHALLLPTLGLLMVRQKKPSDGATAPVRSRGIPALALHLILGAVAGLMAGTLGIGGGIVLVPALHRLLGYPLRRAVATSLISVHIAALAGAVSGTLAGHALWPLALAAGAGAVSGSTYGAQLARFASDRFTGRLFAALAFAISGALVLRRNAVNPLLPPMLLFGSALVLGGWALFWLARKQRRAGRP